ncbi:hypothetical protein JTE90_026968 [Oedothorax gibbosus]|uniref:Uncharacterized protein n=1 Tax=Oedothorax gibbosus TaxID=931172 RepID=A0AAV6TLU9_9ARAC|nr:hypothetical protein JTE90_026968 [Oedothorax gibbosus]
MKPSEKRNALTSSRSEMEIDAQETLHVYERSSVESDHDYCDLPNSQNLGELSQNIVNYIAGYVVKMAERELACEECIAALQGDPSIDRAIA